MSELHDISALRQAELIADGQLSAVELTEHYLRRIEIHDEQIGAYVTVTAELALGQAAQAQRQADRARHGDGVLGPLHGVPIAVKDSCHVAGVPTSFGSPCFAAHPAPHDDHDTERLRDAGTVLLGKTNLSEFELSGHSENRLVPPARSPWDLRCSAGGSSGGSAAAVAAGLAPIAHGSDSAGSVRGPASACGLVGFKPSRGLVHAGPTAHDVSGLTTSGTLARSVEDAAALLDVLATPHPRERPPSRRDSQRRSFRANCGEAPRSLRVALIDTPAVPGVTIAPDCRAALESAADLLDGLGHDVVPARLIADGALGRAFPVVWSVLAASRPVPPGREEELLPLTRHLRAQGSTHSGADFVRALQEFRAIAERTAAHFGEFDIVLTPTLAAPPLPVGDLRNDTNPAAESAAMVAHSPFTCLYNVTGQPAVSLPLHWTPDGLPVGVMLAAHRGEDALLFSVAAQLEAACSWQLRRPPIW
ncbi:amidase [Streptomyces sp. NPDC048514]|uniref:amidase n=1 Tax=Streptomyces sp. NPDC048514 TaxID=3365564 RepID=UPI003716D2C6